MGFHTEFVKELNLFLLSRRVCATLDKAEDLSFVLLVSAKGLLLNTWARKYFDAVMGRVIATVVDNHWHRTGSVAADRQAARAGL